MRITIILVSFFFIIISIHEVHANPVKEAFEQGMSAYKKGDYDTAIKYYGKTLDMYPQFAPAYNFLGLAHKNKGSNPRKVIDYFKKAIKIDPNYSHAYSNIGKTYYSLGEFDDAIQYTKKALEIQPDFFPAQLSLAWIYLIGKNDANGAIKHFERVLEIEQVPYAYFGLGLAYVMDDKNPLVLEMITKLRKNELEDMARQLEKMMWAGQYIPPNIEGMPITVSSGRRKGTIISDLRDEKFLRDIGGGDIPVRLRTSPRNTPQLSSKPDSTRTKYRRVSPSSSSDARIRAMQRRSRNSSYSNKGSGY